MTVATSAENVDIMPMIAISTEGVEEVVDEDPRAGHTAVPQADPEVAVTLAAVPTAALPAAARAAAGLQHRADIPALDLHHEGQHRADIPALDLHHEGQHRADIPALDLHHEGGIWQTVDATVTTEPPALLAIYRSQPVLWLYSSDLHYFTCMLQTRDCFNLPHIHCLSSDCFNLPHIHRLSSDCFNLPHIYSVFPQTASIFLTFIVFLQTASIFLTFIVFLQTASIFLTFIVFLQTASIFLTFIVFLLGHGLCVMLCSVSFVAVSYVTRFISKVVAGTLTSCLHRVHI